MAKSNAPQKVAILGGGMGALTTAYNMSNQPGWQDKYDITIYQLGWRLGGKCASSRGDNMRIEEHGIHGFIGSYFNALPMMNDLFVPFILIDLIVATVLMSMGMMMMPPMTISLPLKILLFVLVDGWHLVVSSIVQSFGS